MKQTLKTTIIVWISLILILASVIAVIRVPFLIFIYAGIGEWQVIVSIIWILFWLSLVITVGIRRERNKE